MVDDMIDGMVDDKHGAGTAIDVSLQRRAFSVASEHAKLQKKALDAGAIATFVGLVRAQGETGKIDSMRIDHYPKMTQETMQSIAIQAANRWPLLAVRVIHRYGELKVGAGIVFVGTASLHRAAAFSAAEYLMDFLKTEAPFWKAEKMGKDTRWVDAKDKDAKAQARWKARKT